jgi:hypothetical protein
MHLLEEENASLRSKLQFEHGNLGLQQQPAALVKIQDLERRLDDMKMSHDQQMLDLQAGVASCNGAHYSLFVFFRSITLSKITNPLRKVWKSVNRS